jgi:hypothetical protein
VSRRKDDETSAGRLTDKRDDEEAYKRRIRE